MDDTLDRVDEESIISCSCTFCERDRSRFIPLDPVPTDEERIDNTIRENSTDNHNVLTLVEEGETANIFSHTEQEAKIPIHKEEVQIMHIYEEEEIDSTEKKKCTTCCFDCKDLFPSNRLCYDSIVAFLRLKRDTNARGNNKNEILRHNVPSVILLNQSKEKRRKVGESSSSSIGIHSRRLVQKRSLQKADDLKSMSGKDLKTGSVTQTTVSELISNDTLSSDDDDYFTIAKTVSSVSIPSFGDLSLCSLEYLDLAHDDPLDILNLNKHERDVCDNGERHHDFENENNENSEKDRNVKSTLSSTSAWLSCKDDTRDDTRDDSLTKFGRSILSWDDEYEDHGINVFTDSFLSYQDALSGDGISYDDVEEKIDISGLRLNNTEDTRAQLDEICEQSVQSHSSKSFMTDADSVQSIDHQNLQFLYSI